MRSSLTGGRPGLGCVSLSGAYGGVGRRAAIGLIHRAVDSGVALIDAFDPGGGETESLVGLATTGHRDHVLISAGTGSSQVRVDCEASLRRLRRERIDLYYVSPAVPGRSLEATMEGAAQLVSRGLAARVGVRGVTAEQLRRAHAVCPVAALVTEYSMWHRGPEIEQIPAARELGMEVIASRPLGRGFLAGRITSAGQFAPGDPRRADPRFSPAQLAAALRRLRAAELVAADLDIGMSRLALAWLRAQGPDILPVPSTRDPVHLEMNLAAAGVRLTAAELSRVAAAFPLPRPLPRPAGGAAGGTAESGANGFGGETRTGRGAG